MTKDELEAKGGAELTNLEIDPATGGRVDAVPVAAARRAGRTLKFLLRKSADVKKTTDVPGNKTWRYERPDERVMELENPLDKLDPQVRAAVELMLREVKALREEVRRLEGFVNPQETRKSAPAKPSTPPPSRQPAGGDGDVLVSKSALTGKKVGEGLFKSVIFGQQ